MALDLVFRLHQDPAAERTRNGRSRAPRGQYNVINRHRAGLARVSSAKLPVQIEANIANQAIPNFPDVGFDDRVLSVIVRSGQWQFCSALAHS